MDIIINAPDRLAHAVLVALCEDSATLARALLVHSKLEPAYIAANPSNGVKRPAQEDVYICKQCHTPFTSSDNTPTCCRYHEGIMEPDYDGDFWADHDEECHGVIDSEFCKEEYPEGFFWDCCGARGDEDKPCISGPHRPRGPPKRLRFGPDTQVNDHADEEATSQSEDDSDQDGQDSPHNDGESSQDSEKEDLDEEDGEDDES